MSEQPAQEEFVKISVDEGWISAGRIVVAGGTMQAPTSVPDVAGLYCFIFDEKKRYYGEANDLRQRIGDYLIYYEATGIESEFRINKALKAHQGAEVRLVTGPFLQSKSQRCTIESRLIKEAKKNGILVLNGGSIQEKITFHAAEIIRLTAKLSSRPEGES